MAKRTNKRKYEMQSFPDMLAAIVENKFTLVKPIGPKFKSEVTWEKWRQVYDENDEIIKDYYFCIGCSAIYNIDISNSGRCLKKHASECIGPNEVENRIDHHFSPVYHAPKRKKIAREDKKAVKEAATKYIVSDMRPIVSMNGTGLTSLLASMTQIGAKYGAMSEEELATSRLIPTRQTVCVFVFVHDTVSICYYFIFKFTAHHQHFVESGRRTRTNERNNKKRISEIRRINRGGLLDEQTDKVNVFRPDCSLHIRWTHRPTRIE